VGKAVSTPLAQGEDVTATSFADDPADDASSPDPEAEPSSIGAIDVDYDPLAFEKAVAWSSVGGAIVLITLVLVLRTIIPKGRKRGWRPGSRKTEKPVPSKELEGAA